jgi:hypothetical protein
MYYAFNDIFKLCIDIVDKFGKLFGWNYYETNTYLFLVAQPVIYVILGLITAALNLHVTIKYKPSVMFTIILSVIAVIGLWHSYYWWNNFSTNTLPFLDNPTQLAKDVIKQMWQEGKTPEGYERINYQRYVFYFLAYVAMSVIINIPQFVYKRNRKRGK